MHVIRSVAEREASALRVQVSDHRAGVEAGMARLT